MTIHCLFLRIVHKLRPTEKKINFNFNYFTFDFPLITKIPSTSITKSAFFIFKFFFLLSFSTAKIFVFIEKICREDGAKVSVGDIIARIPQESSKTRDITGGLPRVADLFEARKPKDSAILAERSGTVELRQGNQGQAALDHHQRGHREVRGADPQVASSQRIRRRASGEGRGHRRRRAESTRILRLQGVEALANYLVREIQDVIRLQGVKINDKHIEVIVRQMLRKIEVLETGDSALLRGEQMDRGRLLDVIAKQKTEGKHQSTWEPLLLGYHQGVAGDRVVHLGGIVPGDDPRAHRGGGPGPEGRSAGPEGERDRRVG